MSAINQTAWNTDAYAAWVARDGTPAELAGRLEPQRKLRRVLRYMGDIRGQRVANPLGSNGKAGVSLALLGAQVTVFDISESNARYALELAAAAGVKLEYVIGDFMALELPRYAERFDQVLMEGGILHWFLNLSDLAQQLRAITKPGGRLVVNDYHPIAKKLLNPDLSVTGDYFEAELHTGPLPVQALLSSQIPEGIMRYWTLGEIVTAFAQHGFRVLTLEETPGWELPAQLPGLFTLVATRD